MTDDLTRDEDFIADITVDVMRSLKEKEFFEALDDLLCPVEQSKAAVTCLGDYRNSTLILVRLGFDGADLDDVFAVLRNQGGCCDCEILYNVAETSRLKAKYWQGKTGVRPASSRHHGGHQG